MSSSKANAGRRTGAKAEFKDKEKPAAIRYSNINAAKGNTPEHIIGRATMIIPMSVCDFDF